MDEFYSLIDRGGLWKNSFVSELYFSVCALLADAGYAWHACPSVSLFYIHGQFSFFLIPGATDKKGKEVAATSRPKMILNTINHQHNIPAAMYAFLFQIHV
jgi:hypothetical protein